MRRLLQRPPGACARRACLRATLAACLLALVAWLPALAGPNIATAAPRAAGAGVGAQAGAAAQLAARYAPITMVREQTDPPCDTSAEQYEPTTVDAVLGNPAVVLQRAGRGGLEDVKAAPGETDIAGRPDGYYLNLHGKVLGNTCVYARDFAQLLKEGRVAPTTYAHIAREPGYSGIALQYWFFWYFNQFNDLHEGDWEGMQLTFDAATPSAALQEEPSEVVLFQHSGGERADWEDAKLRKQGTHPVVYPAAGSHATFYDSAVYVENGRHGSGLGCDNTSEPVRPLRPGPVLLPATAPRSGEFSWLSYEGRWGEREQGFNNGPTGPATKTVWREPFTWMAQQRTTSPHLPGGSIVGPQVTGAFCGAVAAGSELLNLATQSWIAAVGLIAVALLAIGLFIGLTTWGPVQIEQLRARRSFGQLIRGARQLYGRHWRVLVPIALTAFPLVGGVNLLADQLHGGGGLDAAVGRRGLNLALADLVDGLVRPIAQAVVAAAVVVCVRALVNGEPAGFRASWRGVRDRFWRVVGVVLLAGLAIVALAVTVIGIPYAIYKLVAWRFVQQEVLLSDKRVRDALRGSSALVRGHWWRTARTAIFLAVISVVLGPVVSFGLIFTSLPLVAANLLGALIFALMIPYVALGDTLLYFDLGERERGAARKPARRLPWRR